MRWQTTVALAVAVVVLVALGLSFGLGSTRPVRFTTPYQCVLLMGGQAYFGKLEGYGTRNPVLTDVYYVQSQTNSETKEVKSILVKRGREWHAPDRMYLNPDHIILVEPVAADSKVAQLIADSKKK